MTNTEKRSRDEGSGSMELELQELPTSEGGYEGHEPSLAEGTTPHESSEWSNVEPEPSLVPVEGAVDAVQAQSRPPSFAQSEFYTVMFCPIAPVLSWHVCARMC